MLISCNSEPTYTAGEWEETIEEQEYQKFRSEIKEFDKEYTFLIETYNKEFDKLKEDISFYVEKNSNKEEFLALLDSFSEFILDFKKEFEEIDIPEPLDDFYYLKLEQINYLYKVFNGFSSSVESNKYEGYMEKEDELELEADKEKRRVYREYDLDDLINK